MNEHDELERTLFEAGIEIPMDLAERVTLMITTLNEVKLKGLEIKSCASLIILSESQGKDTDDMEEIKEALKHELRAFKNAFRYQEAALHEVMRDTDEV